MAIRINIRKILSVTLWSTVGAGVLVLLVAAIRYRNNNTCKGYRIDISGPSAELFVDRKEMGDILASAGAGKASNKPIVSFDLRRLESTLEKNVWIRDAQLFFDNNGILRVNVIEREPIARIFTTDGNSFYIDSSGVQLPLSGKLPAKLPVFTGYPSTRVRLHGEDSTLTVRIRQLSDFIRQDPFWMAQIAQVDITPARTFELIPMIGNQVIGFGDGDDYQQKFHRLFLFYKEVLSRTGFNKYSRIDVAYAGQVIGTRAGSESNRFDSLQGMNNIRQMIRSAQQLQPDTIRQQNVRPLEHSTLTEQNLANYDLIPGSATDSPDANPNQKTAAPKAVMPNGPKAIMPKNNKKTTKIK
jgi:cell division protein FtsQ